MAETSQTKTRRGPAPLADRMRPQTLDQFQGQEHLVGPGRLIRKAIESDVIPSMLLWGPPGSGKTTLAQVIANTTKRRFVTFSAVLQGVREVRAIVEEARERLFAELDLPADGLPKPRIKHVIIRPPDDQDPIAV